MATFYALFSVQPRPPRTLHVCNGLACRCAGSERLLEALSERIGSHGSDHGGATWEPSPCLGQCDRAPAAFLVQSGEDPTERELTNVDAQALIEILNGALPASPPSATPPQAGQPALRLLQRIGVVDPESLDDYRAHGDIRPFAGRSTWVPRA